MASKALYAAWRRSTSCGAGWICSETNEPGHEQARLRSLMYTPPHTPKDVHKNNPGRRMRGEPEPTRASIVLVAPPEIPRNVHQGKAKAAPKRRPSAAKRIIRAEVPKDTGLALLQLGLVPIAVDTPRPVACRIVGVIDNAINHSA